MAISFTQCGCCRRTILATPRALASSCASSSSSSWRPLVALRRNGSVARVVSCSSSGGGGKWRSCSRSNEAVPFALFTEEPLTTPSSSPLMSEEDLLDVTEQERRLSDAGKAIISPSPSKLLRVGVDVDEVLGTFLASLNTFIAEEYRLQHHVSEYYVYDFMKIWRCSQTEANDRVHAFFESEHFNSGIIPIPGAFQTLRQLSPFCHLVVVTSRQHVIREPTMNWINQHYGGIFKEVHFGNHFALEGEARSKSEICRSLGVEVLIDDNPRYAMECAEHGIEVLLFDLHGDYPWSKTAQGPTHPLITRVHDWAEVQQALLARVQ